MPGFFTCLHCGEKTARNPRIKSGQKYCGKKSCQQSRKNKWECEKMNNDPDYHNRRTVGKARWRKEHAVYQYQDNYRKSHPDYIERNRQQQRARNKKARESTTEASPPKIVKTDALTSVPLIQCGFYELLPYKKCRAGKIVKTDALIVELRASGGLQAFSHTGSG